jgi:hypothetical protein
VSTRGAHCVQAEWPRWSQPPLPALVEGQTWNEKPHQRLFSPYCAQVWFKCFLQLLKPVRLGGLTSKGAKFPEAMAQGGTGVILAP